MTITVTTCDFLKSWTHEVIVKVKTLRWGVMGTEHGNITVCTKLCRTVVYHLECIIITYGVIMFLNDIGIINLEYL